MDSTSRRSFFSASLLLLLSNNLASFLQYVFQAMMARHLPTSSDFGLMNTLFNLIILISLPVSIYVTRQWSELVNVSQHQETVRLWYALLVVTSIFCFACIMVSLVSAPWIASFLRTSPLIIIVTTLGAACFVIFGLTYPLATAQQWFGLIAISSVLGALFRILVGYTGILFHTPLIGAIAATSLCGAVLALFVFARVPWPGWNQLPFRKLFRSKQEWIAPGFATLSTFSLFYSDLFIIRRVFDEEAFGQFALVMKLGQIIFFVIAPIASVIFPKTATTLTSDRSHLESKVVRRALLLGAVILAMSAITISLFAPVALTLLCGTNLQIQKQLPDLVHYLRIAVWCLVPISLSQLVIPSLVARRQERFLFEFMCISLLLPFGLSMFHQKLLYAFFVEGAVGVLLLIFVILRVTWFSQTYSPVAEME